MGNIGPETTARCGPRRVPRTRRRGLLPGATPSAGEMVAIAEVPARNCAAARAASPVLRGRAAGRAAPHADAGEAEPYPLPVPCPGTTRSASEPGAPAGTGGHDDMKGFRDVVAHRGRTIVVCRGVRNTRDLTRSRAFRSPFDAEKGRDGRPSETAVVSYTNAAGLPATIHGISGIACSKKAPLYASGHPFIIYAAIAAIGRDRPCARPGDRDRESVRPGRPGRGHATPGPRGGGPPYRTSAFR